MQREIELVAGHSGSDRDWNGSLPPRDARLTARAEQLDDLEVAWRALAPLVEKSEAHAAWGLARKLEDRIEALSGRPRSSRSAGADGSIASDEPGRVEYEIERLDRDLDSYAARLCDCLEAADPTRFHTYFCREDRSVKKGIAALVDYIVDEDPTLLTRRALLENLVTLLSTGKRNGHRSVVRDPATLTRKLKTSTHLISADDDANDAEIEQEFLDAARCLDAAPSDEILHRMEARRQIHGRMIFTPRALRALVSFNASSWNDAWGDTADDLEAVRERLEDPTTAADATEVRGALAVASRETIQASVKRPRPISSLASMVALLTILGAVLLVGTRSWWSASEGTVELLPGDRLHSISPLLTSGYRSANGSGTLFVGGIDSRWLELGAMERQKVADEIVSGLGSAGVREILLYDDGRRIALHSAEGLPLRLGP